MALVEDVYRISKSFPKEEIYGLTVQLRRAAISVPSNLSEGAARSSSKEFLVFINYALGSLAETETQLILAARLGFAYDEETMDRLGKVRALMLGLRNHVRGTLRSHSSDSV